MRLILSLLDYRSKPKELTGKRSQKMQEHDSRADIAVGNAELHNDVILVPGKWGTRKEQGAGPSHFLIRLLSLTSSLFYTGHPFHTHQVCINSDFFSFFPLSFPPTAEPTPHTHNTQLMRECEIELK